MTSVLIAAVKELKTEKDAQHQQIKELKAEKDAQHQQIVALEARLAAIERASRVDGMPAVLSGFSLSAGWPL